MDSSYQFTFIVPHTDAKGTIRFGTIWREEENSVATYRLENLQVEPLKHVPALDEEKESQAWLSFFSGSPDASQLAWQNICHTHR